jgi:hypothetical protein
MDIFKKNVDKNHILLYIAQSPQFNGGLGMKKVLLILSVVLFSLSLLACGGQQQEEVKVEAEVEAPAQADTAAVADSTTPPPPPPGE